MKADTTTLIYFSPTQTTRKVVEAIAHGAGVCPVGRVDLTPPAARMCQSSVASDSLAIIGAPVYGGRIPAEATHRLRRVRSDSAPAVVVAVYGNREYEDALLELRDIALEVGFVPVAGAAFIGEHSYSSFRTPIATGRPDADDLEKARAFGTSVTAKLATLEGLDAISRLQVPGNFPYRKWSIETPGAPVTISDLCTRCGECVTACPMAAIDTNDPLKTDEAACILCSACVKVCPAEARVWELAWIKRVSRWLKENHSARKEPEVFL